MNMGIKVVHNLVIVEKLSWLNGVCKVLFLLEIVNFLYIHYSTITLESVNVSGIFYAHGFVYLWRRKAMYTLP